MINLLFIFFIIFFILKENNIENFKLKDVSKIYNNTEKMLKEIPAEISKSINKKMKNLSKVILPTRVRIIFMVFMIISTISSLIIIYKSLFGSECTN